MSSDSPAEPAPAPDSDAGPDVVSESAAELPESRARVPAPRAAVDTAAEIDPPDAADDIVHEVGCIDSYGFSIAAGAWLAIGWVPQLPSALQECEIAMHFARASIAGRCFRAPFHRADLPGKCEGVVVLATCGGRNLGPLICIELKWDEGDVKLFSTEKVEQLSDAQISGSARAILTSAPRDVAALAIVRALSRQGFGGRSTLHELGCPIHLAIDEVIRCGDAGIVLIGWFVAEEHAARRITLRAGHLTAELDFDTAIRIRRDDVSASMQKEFGLHEPSPGFLLFVPDVIELDEHAHLQVETRDLSVGYVSLPQPRLRGVPAMRRMLESFALRYEDMVRAYDLVIGPAIGGLNEDRLKTRVNGTVFHFGAPVEDPTCSVIVPLYGRIDFMEYQLALFSREPSNQNHEFIYVLDDPSLKSQTLTLAETCVARFGLPFRVLVLERNVGYAPANNAGLRIARGDFICFLNSDVFPGTDDWLDVLTGRLAENARLGAVGPALLFEDGTIQHRGLTYEKLPEFGNWLFPMHPGKGMRLPARRRGMETQRAITGACMVMRRSLADELGGFDERFVIGDFEDSDLCLRIIERNLLCAVDLDVQLYHLERQSQGDMSNSWRFNLTLYNAWLHESRWSGLLSNDRRLMMAAE